MELQVWADKNLRLAVIISCPGIPNAQLNGIFSVDNGKSSTQAKAILRNP